MKASRSEPIAGRDAHLAEHRNDGPDLESATIVPFPARPMQSDRHPKDSAPALDRRLQTALGQNLRVVFEHIASEPVPERFVKLLQELEAKENQK